MHQDLLLKPYSRACIAVAALARSFPLHKFSKLHLAALVLEGREWWSKGRREEFSEVVYTSARRLHSTADSSGTPEGREAGREWPTTSAIPVSRLHSLRNENRPSHATFLPQRVHCRPSDARRNLQQGVAQELQDDAPSTAAFTSNGSWRRIVGFYSKK